MHRDNNCSTGIGDMMDVPRELHLRYMIGEETEQDRCIAQLTDDLAQKSALLEQAATSVQCS